MITFNDAIYEALDEEMELDNDIFLLGEDLSHLGLTKSLYEKYGSERVIDTPIAESGFTGAAVGAAALGMRPVVYHGRADFMLYAFDSIANQAAKWRFQTGDLSKLQMVIRVGTGGYRGSGCHHSQSLEALFMNIPGINLAIPSTPYDAKGLLKSALRSTKPVLFFEHNLLRSITGPVPDHNYVVPFGEAEVKMEGSDVTVIATALMVQKSLNVAKKMQAEGINLEVLDLKTLVPLDHKAIIESVRKTGRLVTVEEGCRIGGIGAEVTAVIAEATPSSLKASVIRVANPDAMIPYKAENEAHILPQEHDIEIAIKNVLKS